MNVCRRDRCLQRQTLCRRGGTGGRQAASAFLVWCCFAAAACANAADSTSARRDLSRADGDRILTPTQLQACLSRKDGMQAEAHAALDEKARIEAEKAEITRSGENLASERIGIDGTQAEVADAYNQRAAQRDRRIDAYEARVVRYNRMAERVRSAEADYASSCETRRYDERDLIDAKRKKR